MTTLASLDFDALPSESVLFPTAPWSVSGSAPSVTTAAAHHGTQGIRWATTGASARLMYDTGAAFAAVRVLSFYFRFGTLPAENSFLASVLDGTAGLPQAELRFLVASGGVQMRNGGSAAGGTSPALSAGTTYRVEWRLDPEANQQSLRIYVGNSTTVFHEGIGAALTSDTSRVFSVGPRTGAAGGTNLDVDSIVIADDWTGPYVGTPLDVSAGDDRIIEVGDNVVLNGSVSGGTGPYTYAWTVVSGAGAFDNASAEDPAFTPSGVGEHVVRLTVTDDAAQVAFAEATVLAFDLLSPTTASGWTTIGGGAASRLAAVTDENLATYVETAGNPTAEVFTVKLPPLLPPGGDLNGRVTLSTDLSTATVTPRLYRPNGTTLVSVGDPITATMAVTEHITTFAAADIAAAALDPTADWAAGMVVTYTAEV